MHLTVQEKEKLFNMWRDDRDLLYDRVLQSGLQVSGDSWSLIPRGKKVAIWYTYFRDTPASIIVDLDWKSKPTDFTLVLSSFKPELAYGTILSGILLEQKGRPLFCCTHVNMLLGQWKSRALAIQINSMYTVFQSMIRHDSRLPGLTVTLPKTVFNLEDIDDAVRKSPIPIHCIRISNSATNQIVGTYRQTINESARAVMLVKPEIDEDIYSLWCGNQIGYAVVPDYKTSILLNSIFRNIKENDNLDLLEESDSEDEFENTQEDRFIKCKEGLTMRVEYIPRFNGWKPYELCNLPPSSQEDIERVQSMFRERRHQPRTQSNKKPNIKHKRASGYSESQKRGIHYPHNQRKQWLGPKKL
jgi:hypothetical protein